MNTLNKRSLVSALKNGGIRPGDIVYVTGNMGRLGIPQLDDGSRIQGKAEILKFYADTILEFIGKSGTIVFPTHSWGLVRSDETYIPEKTPCDYLFSEHLRVNLNCKRQLHPFASVAAYGAKADEIVSEKITRHPYGPQTPFEKLEKSRSMHLSIGLQIAQSFSAAHYCEFVCGVPYRYTKSFKKRIRLNKQEDAYEEFFLYVCYLNPELTRDRNKKAFQKGGITPHKEEIGKGVIETIRLDTTIRKYIEMMSDDPYIWLTEVGGNGADWPWFK